MSDPQKMNLNDKEDQLIPTGIELMVCVDIARRQRHGVEKYGTTVSENPLSLIEWHQHHYEELLDAAVYTKKCIIELTAATQTFPEKRNIAPDQLASILYNKHIEAFGIKGAPSWDVISKDPTKQMEVAGWIHVASQAKEELK